MTEKIIYTHGKVAPPMPATESAAARDATRSRSFAEFLAEAEAVRDVVQLNPWVAPATHGMRGTMQAALHGVAGLILGPLPRMVINLRSGKRRRDSAKG